MCKSRYVSLSIVPFLRCSASNNGKTFKPESGVVPYTKFGAKPISKPKLLTFFEFKMAAAAILDVYVM